jgi:hypothetical protein
LVDKINLLPPFLEHNERGETKKQRYDPKTFAIAPISEKHDITSDLKVY